MFTLINTFLLIAIIVMLSKKKFYVVMDKQSDRNDYRRK